MKDWQSRVVREADELRIKANKLGDFLGSEKRNKLSFDDQTLLWQQYAAMMTYSNILAARIARFFGDTNEV